MSQASSPTQILDVLSALLYNEQYQAVISVKGGKNISVEMVCSFGDVVNEQKAAIGVFISLEAPTKPIVDWPAKSGVKQEELL